MGFVGSLFGGNSGNSFQAQAPTIQAPTTNDQAIRAYRDAQSGLQQQAAFVQALQAQNGLGNQSNVYNQLAGVANGTGPNPALAQFNQATGQNIASQAALMAGQRGANSNVGLLARQIGQQGAGIQQQAAGQGATLQAQQQLGALGQMGSLATQQAQQQAQGLQGFNQAALAGQQNILGSIAGQNTANVNATNGMNSANAAIAGKQADAQFGLLGGLASAIPMGASLLSGLGGSGKSASAFSPAGGMSKGGMAGYAEGGEVQNSFQPSSYAARFLAGWPGGPAPEAQSMAQGGTAQDMTSGGPVPGKAQVAGDSPKNDTVPAELSPGEIVIPRSITQHPDAAKLAAAFVQEQLEKHKSKSGNFDVGGTQADMPPQNLQAPPPAPAYQSPYSANYSGLFNSLTTPPMASALESAPKPENVPTIEQSPRAPANVQAQPQQAGDPYGINTQSKMFESGLNQQMKALGGQGAAASNLANAEVQVYQDQAQQQKEWADKVNQNYAQLQQHRDQATQAVQNSNIDPNRYLSNMGTGQKIATAIGLVLGGIAGGGLHQENPAAKYLNDQINRDIDAQKAELGKRENLLSANLQDFGVMDHAAAMTKMQITDQVANQLGMAEAKYKGTAAGNNAAMLRGQLLQQNAERMGQLAAEKTAMDGQRGVAGSGSLPAALDPSRETRVEVGGQVFHAPDKETADKTRTQFESLDELENVLNRIEDFNKNKGRVSGLPTRDKGTAKVLNREMESAIAHAQAKGGQISRLIDKFTDMAPTAGAWFQGEDQAKTEEARNFLANQKQAFIRNALSNSPVLKKPGK